MSIKAKAVVLRCGDPTEEGIRRSAARVGAVAALQKALRPATL